MTAADLELLRTWATTHRPFRCFCPELVLSLIDRDALRVAELADTDAHLAELRERLDGLRCLARPFCPLPHPCA